MKGAHSAILKEIVDSGYVLTENAEKSLHEIAEAFTSGFQSS
jgi:F-type H+-transporting ATPase subunit alpha